MTTYNNDSPFVGALLFNSCQLQDQSVLNNNMLNVMIYIMFI